MKKICIGLIIFSTLALAGCGGRKSSPVQVQSGESAQPALPPEEFEMVDVNAVVNDLILQMQALERSLKGEDGEFFRRIDEVNAALEELSGQLRSLETDLEETEESIRELREYFDGMRTGTAAPAG